MDPYIPIPADVAVPVYMIMGLGAFVLVAMIAIGGYKHQQYEDEQHRLEAAQKNEKYDLAKADTWNHLYTVGYVMAYVTTLATVYVIMTCWFPQAAHPELTQYVSAAVWLTALFALINTALVRLTVSRFLEDRIYRPLVMDKIRNLLGQVADGDMTADDLLNMASRLTEMAKARK